MKILIRILMVLELISFLSISWAELRDVAFPDGTTPAQALIVFILLVVWEEVLKISRRLTKLERG